MKHFFLLLFFSIYSNKFLNIEISGIFKISLFDEVKISEYIDIRDSIIIGPGFSYKKIYLNIGILDINNTAISPYVNFNILLHDYILFFVDFFENENSKFDWKFGVKLNYKVLNLKINAKNIYKSLIKIDTNKRIVLNQYKNFHLTNDVKIFNDKNIECKNFKKERIFTDEINNKNSENALIETYNKNIIPCEQYVLACGKRRNFIKADSLILFLDHEMTLKIDELIVSLNTFEVSAKKILLMYHLINLRSEYIKLSNPYDSAELIRTFCFFSANDGVNFLKYLNESYSKTIYLNPEIKKNLFQLRENKDVCVESLRAFNYYIMLNFNKIENFEPLLQFLRNNLSNYIPQYELKYDMILDINKIFRSSYKMNYNFTGSNLELLRNELTGLTYKISKMNELTSQNVSLYNNFYEIYLYYNNLNSNSLKELNENYYMLQLAVDLLNSICGSNFNVDITFLLKEGKTLEELNLELLEAHKKDLLEYTYKNEPIEYEVNYIDFLIIPKKIFNEKIFKNHDNYKNNIVGVNLSDKIIRLFIEKYGIALVNNQIKNNLNNYEKSGIKMNFINFYSMKTSHHQIFVNINHYSNYLWMLSLKNKNKYFFEIKKDELGSEIINISKKKTPSSLSVDDFYKNILAKIEDNMNQYKKIYSNKTSYEVVDYEILLRRFPFFSELNCKSISESIDMKRVYSTISKEKLDVYINKFSANVHNFCKNFRNLSETIKKVKVNKITKNKKTKQGLILLNNIALIANKLKIMDKIGSLTVDVNIDKKIDKYLTLINKPAMKNSYIWAYNFITDHKYIFDKKLINIKNYKKYPDIKQVKESKSYFIFKSKGTEMDNIYNTLKEIRSNYNSIQKLEFLKKSEVSEIYGEFTNSQAIYNFFSNSHKSSRKIEDNIDKDSKLMIPNNKKKLKKIMNSNIPTEVNTGIENLNILFDEYLLSDIKYNYYKEIKECLIKIRWQLHSYVQSDQLNKMYILECLGQIREGFDFIKEKYLKFNNEKNVNEFFNKTEEKINIYEKMLEQLFNRIANEDFSKESGELLYLCVTYIPLGIKDNYIFDSAFLMQSDKLSDNNCVKLRVIDIVDTVSFENYNGKKVFTNPKRYTLVER